MYIACQPLEHTQQPCLDNSDVLKINMNILNYRYLFSMPVFLLLFVMFKCPKYKSKHILFTVSIFFPHWDLKAEEHTEVGTTTSRLRKWDPLRSTRTHSES